MILSNRKVGYSIFKAGKKLNGRSLVFQSEDVNAQSILFRTIHSFKGLEADVVVMVLHKRKEDLKALDEELLYVGFTRARHLLYVVEVGG